MPTCTSSLPSSRACLSLLLFCLQHNALMLPLPLPAGPNSNDEPPAFPDDSEHYDPEVTTSSILQESCRVVLMQQLAVPQSVETAVASDALSVHICGARPTCAHAHAACTFVTQHHAVCSTRLDRCCVALYSAAPLQEAVRSLKQHWVEVRQFDTAQRMQRVSRYSERLKAVTNPGLAPAAVNMVVTQALIAQHQQQQASQGFPSLQAALMLQQQQQGPGTLPAVSAALQMNAAGQLLLHQGLAAQQQQPEQQSHSMQPQRQQHAQAGRAVQQEQDKDLQQDAQPQQLQQQIKQEEQEQQDDIVAEQAEAVAG
jgi:hypothetical protein